jgi:hypothetical protein
VEPQNTTDRVISSSKIYKNCQIATSSHNGFSFGSYQPGGTSTSILGNAIACIVSKIVDSSSMGRWSGYKLHTNRGTYLNILTVYQSTKSKGLQTNYVNQMEYLKKWTCMLRSAEKLLVDLQEMLNNSFNKKYKTTIVMIDANDRL